MICEFLEMLESKILSSLSVGAKALVGLEVRVWYCRTAFLQVQAIREVASRKKTISLDNQV